MLKAVKTSWCRDRAEWARLRLSLLRSKIQFLPDTPFVFLGSVRNRMRDIFDSPKSPFFKSAISFGVERIEESAMTDFLIGRFRAGNRSIDRETIGKILDAADYISGDIQELCETTWLVTGDEIGRAHV